MSSMLSCLSLSKYDFKMISEIIIGDCYKNLPDGGVSKSISG